MKERPVLFSAPMVRAILDGSKTQTRRVMKIQPQKDSMWGGGYAIVSKAITVAINVFNRNKGASLAGDLTPCPYGKPGDRLWVRETWSGEYWLSDVKPSERLGLEHPGSLVPFPPATWYWADGEPNRGDWEKPRPSIHMPRWASRITLEITSVRVERLNQISSADAMAEGICDLSVADSILFGLPGHELYAQHPIRAFSLLWESINGPESWDANPWVWVIEFKRIEQ